MELDTNTLTNTLRTAIRDYVIGQYPAFRSAPSMSLAASQDAPDGVMQDEPIAADSDSAAVVNDGIISFVKGMSAQNRSDVEKLYLHASLVANKKFPNLDQGEERHGLFCKVLQDTGWLITDTSYRRLEKTDSSFTMDHVALDIIESAISSATLPVSNTLKLLQIAKGSVAALKENQAPLGLFQSSTVKPEGGNFSVGACLETDEGEIVMVLGSIYFMSTITTTDVLFTHWNSTDVKVFFGSTLLRLNTELAELGRDALAYKLRDHVADSIAKYEI